MATRLYSTQHLVPAGTAIAAPVMQPVVLEDNNLDEMTVIIPDGHLGFTGLAVRSANAPVVPFILGTWITGNNDELRFPYAAEVTANGLTVAAYNIDIYDHTFYIRWQISDLGPALPVTIVSPQTVGTPALPDVAAVAALTGSVS